MTATLHAFLKSSAIATAFVVAMAGAPAYAATAGSGASGQGGATGGTTGGAAGGQTGGVTSGPSSGATGDTGGGAVASPGGDGRSGGGVARRDELVPGRCGIRLELPDPQAFASPGDGAVAVSHATKYFVRDCSCDTQACIADALDAYAAALAEVAPRLRPELRELPAVVARAATRVRAAPGKAAAVAILRETAATVHKAIALIRAPDPDTMKLGTRGGDVVSDALNVAALSLERSTGI